MSARSLAVPPSSSGCAEVRPEISWIPEWLDRGALATLGPFAGFTAALVAAFSLVMALQDPLRQLGRGPALLLVLGLAVVAAALVFVGPHWWSWRVCGPSGGGRFLGAALWLAHFPSHELGESARVLAASALCAGDYLGACRADALGSLALARHLSLMSLWCAEMGERLGDPEIVGANREMLARCRRLWERLDAPSLV